ncbi:E3 ubiquitin-protein ligase RNF8 isoform X2 [Protopterus annectens]|uniref:E3 ubiquitin-protein ligase RNF8 isoform X2 n=1 Tax=Protopterus annectens TaxID=7888 RepID=UPI001CFA57F7|nr:E3 ubiquitin-protein ligase RNF8 isoform X2 [Protopterus annectens]
MVKRQTMAGKTETEVVIRKKQQHANRVEEAVVLESEAASHWRPLGKVVWCLRRVGLERDWLLLPDNTEVTVGRGLGVTYQLLSKTCPLMVSRNHCVFKQDADGLWVVTDNKSLNGVWVNNVRIESQKPYQIVEGDLVQLGVPLENESSPEYEYRLIREGFETISPCLAKRLDQEVTKQRPMKTKRKINTEDSETSGTECSSGTRKLHRSCGSNVEGESLVPRSVLEKQPTQSVDPVVSTPGTSKVTESTTVLCNSQDFAGSLTQVVGECSINSSVNSSELARLKENIKGIQRLKTKVQALEHQSAVLQAKPHSESVSQRELKQLEQELQELRKQLLFEQQLQRQTVEKLEKTFHEEEQRLEHRKLMEDLQRSRKDFEEILQAKDKELEETKEEKEKVMAQKQVVLTQMSDVLENELQCIICSEHFIEAVTLNCSHSFCSYCITEWKKRKHECPICRQTICTQTRSIVLDNCIERIVENLGAEVKERRATLLQERKEKKQEEVVSVSDSDSDSSDISSVLSLRSYETYSDTPSGVDSPSFTGDSDDGESYFFIEDFV